MIKETFNIAPVPASRARITRYSAYFPKRYSDFRDNFSKLLLDYDTELLEGKLYAKLDFYIEIPKSWSKKKSKEMDGRYCLNNADLDNYCKAALDCLEGKYYENDRQVCMIRARKFYSTNTRIEFELTQIKEDL